MKTREEWEQELRDRQQSNYVFPGTVINSTRMYRDLLRNNFPLNRFLRVSIFLLGSMQILFATYLSVSLISALLSGRDFLSLFPLVTTVIVIPVLYLLGMKLVNRAAFPGQQTPKRQD